MKHYGMLAELSDADRLMEAVREVRKQGYTRVEAYAPFPVDGLAEALGKHRDRVPLLTLIGGLIGGGGGYLMQWYSATISYPVNVGGRPLHSWPSFIPVTFEMTVLGAAIFAVFGMLLLNGLPRLYHPLFNVPEFDLASRNRFFLCVRCDDPNYEAAQVRAMLHGLQSLLVCEVPQ